MRISVSQYTKSKGIYDLTAKRQKSHDSMGEYFDIFSQNKQKIRLPI